jgi:deoxycytidylate deaminase
VGAAVFRADWSIISTGYNGAPPGVEIDWANRDRRRDIVIHAEMNALRYATRDQTRRGYMCSTHQPCEKCLPMIAAYGLEIVYYDEPYEGPMHGPVELRKLAEELEITLIQAT